MAETPVRESEDMGRAETPPECRIHGEVRIAGTNSPISGLVARAYATLGDGDRRGADQISLGSSFVENGRFEIRFAPPPGASGDQRLSIQVQLIGSAATKPLAESDVRVSTGREEAFLLFVEADLLAAQGRPDALELAAASADPDVAARAVAAKRAFAQKRREDLLVERQTTVAERRVEDAELDARIRNRAISELTGVSEHSAAWKRLVRPGKDAVEVANRYQRDLLEQVMLKQVQEVGADTYVVLSPDELADLGNPLDPKKVDALLRGTRSEGGIERDDPMAQLCLTKGVPNPFASPPASPVIPPPTSTSTQSADAKIEELVGSIQPPDTYQPTGPQGGTEAAGRVTDLSIAKGPADLPATYEFHRLELAFDHVWEDARAEGYLEAVKAAYRAVEAAGGDMEAVLESPGRLLPALWREGEMAGLAPPEPRSPGVIHMQPTGTNPKPDLDFQKLVRDIKYDGEPPGAPEQPDPGPPPPADPNLGHPFTVFAANTVNFGLLVTYQQRFEPLDYQVGRMVGTRTLGPKESYSFTTRQVLKKSFNRKQMESNQRMRRDEAEDTSRDEAEVVRRSQNKTNFAMSTSGGYDLGPIGEGTVSTNLGSDNESSSQETKRSQRSAVRKAAQEVKNETKIELENAESSEFEVTEKREVKNENDELALTCVFYELQRRFRVSERLYRITPVALVAQQMPSLADINEAWILRHDWIIRRFLPDDSFESALTYLATSAAGDRVILRELKAHMDSLRTTVRELGQQLSSALLTANQEYDLLRQYVKTRATIASADKAEGWLDSLWGNVAADDRQEQLEKIRVLEETTKERYEAAAAHERDLRARTDRELGALQVATDQYTKALATQENRQVEINRLIEHIRQNILLYQQGIWSYEHPDQRFLRHHALTAPRLHPLKRTYTLEPKPGYWPAGITPQPGKTAYRVTFTTSVDPDVAKDDERATLAELLDLHNWIGMFGNYLVYPLRESNALTDFMMTPYLDNTLGLRDPDGPGNWTLDQFTEYVTCLREKLSPDEYAEIEGTLRKQYQELLASPHRNGEEITIPSNGVYMQMLVDSGKVLEKYKEEHRHMDVLKVREEVRTAAIDNVRRAKLILANELEDPNIESVKNVYYHGDAPHDGDE